jgi:hypothetical protein
MRDEERGIIELRTQGGRCVASVAYPGPYPAAAGSHRGSHRHQENASPHAHLARHSLKPPLNMIQMCIRVFSKYQPDVYISFSV